MPEDDRVNFDPASLLPREMVIYPEEITGNLVQKVFVGSDKFFDATQINIQKFQ